jgi:hypothetical protein
MSDAVYLRQKSILTDLDKLVLRVERGEISREEAEAERVRLGIARSLASLPDPSQFDPMQESFWSLPMSLAYLQWRAADPVREVWDKYRAEVWEWQRAAGVRGFVLRPRPAATFFDVDHASNAGGTMTSAEARQWLWRQAERGKLHGFGACAGSGQRGPIQPHEWNDLHPRDLHGRPVLRSVNLPHQGFDRVSVASKELIDLLTDHQMIPKQLPALSQDSMNGHDRAVRVRRGGPGRHPIFLPEEFEAMKNEVFELLDYHGGLGGDPALRSRRALLLKLEGFVDANSKRFQGKRVVRSTIDPQVKAWVAEWEGRKKR